VSSERSLSCCEWRSAASASSGDRPEMLRSSARTRKSSRPSSRAISSATCSMSRTCAVIPIEAAKARHLLRVILAIEEAQPLGHAQQTLRHERSPSTHIATVSWCPLLRFHLLARGRWILEGEAARRRRVR